MRRRFIHVIAPTPLTQIVVRFSRSGDERALADQAVVGDQYRMAPPKPVRRRLQRRLVARLAPALAGVRGAVGGRLARR